MMVLIFILLLGTLILIWNGNRKLALYSLGINLIISIIVFVGHMSQSLTLQL